MRSDRSFDGAPEEWLKVAEPPPVTNSIQIWKTNVVDLSLRDLSRCLLTPEEQTRASRIRFGTARDEFILGRSMLRALLGRALESTPECVPLVQTQLGKPKLAGVDELWFNVAHSHGTVLIALTRRGPVGVDVEWLDRPIDPLDVVDDAFTVGEAKLIRELEAGDRVPAFYRCWTRREAVLKADGCGLTVPLQSFTIPFLEGADAVVQLPAHGCGVEKTFLVRELPMGPRFVAAIACEGTTMTLQLLQMSANAAIHLLS